MFKWISVLLLALAAPIFSQDDSDIAREQEAQDAAVATLIGYGSGNLLIQNYELALAEFERAADLLDKYNRESPELTFFLYFGQAIAYDNLGELAKCKEALGNLFILCFSEETQALDDDSYNAIEDLAVTEFMKQLAALAPTPEVRHTLLGFISAIDEE